MLIDDLEATITTAYKNITDLTTKNTPHEIRTAVNAAIHALDQGSIRVSTKVADTWVTHAWIKQAILLYFKITPLKAMSGYTQFYDKVPLKYANDTVEQLGKHGVRIVPPACVRFGAFIGAQSVLMPSYVNIGAYVDTGCMIDTWATIGSCAQIGKNCHISGGTGIGGVLEPLQANPTIIEDNCFIGARSEIVEGVVVEENAVIAMGVFISQSTPIYNRMTQQTSYGRVPAGAVVIPGSLPAKDGSYHRAAAIIIKQVDAQTRNKTSINQILRGEHEHCSKFG